MVEITEVYKEMMKWTLGYGTRLVWNSVISTLIVPSNLKEVSLETSAVVCEFSDAIQAQIYDLLAK